MRAEDRNPRVHAVNATRNVVPESRRWFTEPEMMHHVEEGELEQMHANRRAIESARLHRGRDLARNRTLPRGSLNA